MKVPGIISTRVGYTGGNKDNPTYEDVLTGTTDHAETVEVTFDSEKVSFKQLLEVFWGSHDPTEKDKQGPDVGRQYRSAIFYLNDEQKEIAASSRKELEESGKYDKEIVTEIEKASIFWEAEEYHQKYFAKQKGEV